MINILRAIRIWNWTILLLFFLTVQMKDNQTKTPENKWRNNTTAGECLRHLCLSEKLSDVCFKFKNCSRKLPAHRLFLSMRSEVFEAMFYGLMADSNDTIMIDDIETSVMEMLLRYMYTDVTDLDENNVLACLYAANKYALSGLVKKCSEFLESSISPTNVCTIYEQAKFYNMTSLQNKCFTYIMNHPHEVLESDGFRVISQESLQSILENDQLSSDESLNFTAAMKWAESLSSERGESQKNEKGNDLRTYLGDVIYAIRFPLMSIETFATVVAPTNLLTKDEMLMIYQYLATKRDTRCDQMLGRFCCKERTPLTFEFHIQNLPNAHRHTGHFLKMEASSPIRIISVNGTFVHGVTHVTALTPGNYAVEVRTKTEGNCMVFLEPLLLKPQSAHILITFHKTLNDFEDNHGTINAKLTGTFEGTDVRLVRVPKGLKSVVFSVV